ncbi:hypothetical protein [Pseudomonas sp. BMS12]|uniref:hypothetical protein n=1 Tax=Pseudomonas sp. BMS12 TaxID=1796033 RepID=UPI00083B77C1|nr:hypothetical protein [Pseudomonas sp. BMS12]
MANVRIERRESRGRPLWVVTFGRHTLSFHEELAARTFAAQLHMRLDWLREQAQVESLDEHPS